MPPRPETARPQPHLRVADATDLPAILAIYAQPGVDDGAMLPLAQAKVILARLQQYPDYHLFVAEVDGHVVGTFALLIMDNLGHLGAPSGVVEDVAVDPAWQGKGIGKAMMQFAMVRCQEAGCYKLTLSANQKRQAAHTFYTSLGFRQHGYSFWVDL